MAPVGVALIGFKEGDKVKWLIQGVFSFDASAAHIIPDCIPDNFTGRSNYQCKLRFGYVPGTVLANPYESIITNYPVRCAFKKAFRSFSFVYFAVKIGTSCCFAFFLPADHTAIIRYTAGP